MAKKVQLMTNAKEWQTVNGVEVLVDVPNEDIDPITDSSCVKIEGHRTLEETISQDNMFTPKIVETKVHSKVGGVYHDNVVDGAYEEAILYGNTQVNLVESMTSGTKYIPHSFTSFQGNESKIGNYNSGRTNQVAPLVKGVTMVNLVSEGKHSYSIPSGNATRVDNIKGDTLYTLSFTFTTKNTNAGITIQSFNNGTYLEDTKSQTNLGDKVVMTFTTHAEANQINICNNKAYGGETIQLDNIMVIEGDVTDLDLPFFKGMRSVELSRPLTNLFTDDLVHYNQNTSSTNTNGDITVTSTSVSSWNNTDYYLKNLKPHTKYIVMWDSLTTTQTATTQQEILVCVVSIQYNIKLGGINEDEKCPTLRSIIFDTRDKDLSQIVFRIHASMSNSEATSTTVKGLRVFEWDDSLRTLDLQSIGYFSGTKYVSARALETEGKNLYPYGNINFTNDYVGWCDAKGKTNMYGDIAQKSSCRFLLKKGTYTFSVGSTTNINPIYLINDKEQQVSDLSAEHKTFTLTQDTYCTIRVKTIEANVATTATNIQIERGETATTYEAYDGRYYKPRETEEIILRSLPNGVCDTFNLQTGELVQNIGEVVLDGSENFDTNGNYYWYVNLNLTNEDYTTFMLDGRNGKPSSSNFICDKLPNKPTWLTVETGIWADSAIVLTLPTSIATTTSQLKEYLQSNPITVQYELKEPIITKLQTYDRVYNGKTNVLVDMGNNLSVLTYYSNNYYLKVGNLSPIPAIIEPIASIPYDVRLKPSTLYTIKYNRGGNSNSMKFDLGGSVVEKTNSIADLVGIAEEFTIKTPTILSHEQIRLSGTGYAHNFIIVEGDITGTELPYFEGMKDVKMPIVKNIGKNLFNPNIIGDSGQYIRNDMGSLVEDITSKYTVGYICVKPNTKYYLYVKGLQRVYFLDNNKQWISRTNILYQQGTQTYTINTNFTTGFNCHYIQIQYRVDELDLTNATLVEYGDNNPHVEHKENSVYAVQGEIPITSEMVEQGGFNGTDKIGQPYDNCKVSENENIRIRTKELIPIKTNTQYIILNQTSPNLNHVFYYFDGNKKFLGQQAEVNTNKFITPNDCCYVSLMLSKNNNANITTTDIKQEQFHMYELDSTINLRSLPNGVKDELNLLTGEYIQRVGEIVLDGSDDENWTLNNTENTTTNRFIVSIQKSAVTNDEKGKQAYICDKLQKYLWSDTETIGITIISDAVFLYNKNIDYSINALRNWLQQNPITVQYELAEPIISHVRLVSNNQEREVGVKLPNGVCNTYNPSTGITTVRVGKIVLDGSEDYATYEGSTGVAPSTPQMLNVWTAEPISDAKPGNAASEPRIGAVLSSGFPYFGPLVALDSRNQEMHFISHTGRLNFNIALSKLPTHDISGLKTYLASNPITVWYELKYPQIQPNIVLPNGVHDEYNPETGVYTKRVGFVELDGSVDEKLDSIINNHKKENTIVFFAYQYTPLAKKYEDRGKGYPIYTNQFEYVDVDLGQSGAGGLSMDVEGAYMAFDGNPCFAISKKKLEPFGFTNDMNTKAQVVPIVSKYLSQNPLKVWYELETPITYQLTPYFGLPQPYAYEDGYLIHDSAYPETTLPPEFKYKLVANRTGQVMQNSRKLQEHTTRLSNLEALIIEATIQSLFDRELQTFELELMDIQLIDLGE